jgi:hypothetical protein
MSDPQTRADTPPRSSFWTSKLFRILIIVLVLVISVVIFAYRERLAELAALGYPGILLVSILGNATIVLPAPWLALVFAMGSALPPVSVGLAAGVGSALGELTSSRIRRPTVASLPGCSVGGALPFSSSLLYPTLFLIWPVSLPAACATQSGAFSCSVALVRSSRPFWWPGPAPSQSRCLSRFSTEYWSYVWNPQTSRKPGHGCLLQTWPPNRRRSPAQQRPAPQSSTVSKGRSEPTMVPNFALCTASDSFRGVPRKYSNGPSVMPL